MFISFITHSGGGEGNKRQTNRRMSKSVKKKNASEITGARTFQPELELSLHLNFTPLMYGEEELLGKVKEKGKKV